MDLTWEHGKVLLRSWRHGWVQSPFVTVVTVGRLTDGRWFAERHGRGAGRRDKREGACVYGVGDRGRRLALDTARRWRRTVGGEWVEDRITAV